MFAIVENGGKQYRVSKDEVLNLEKFEGSVGDQLETDKVLMISDKTQTKIGTPYVSGSSVKLTILGHGRDRKIRVFKMKRRKRYRRTIGHRQAFTKVRVDNIVVD